MPYPSNPFDNVILSAYLFCPIFLSKGSYYICQSSMETDLETTDVFYAFGPALLILMLTVLLALIVLQQEDR